MSLKKSISRIFSANVIQLITGLIVGFWVPNIMSISGYASIKTYTLLVSYIGFLHFGFIDGLYIKYGGTKEDCINLEELKGEYYFLLVFQTIITVIFIIISIISKSIILCLFGFTILPLMISSFYKYYFQAVGNFKNYSIIMYLYSISYLLLNIILIFIIKSDNFIFYSLCTVISYFISGFVFHISFMKKINKIKPIYNKNNFNKIIKNRLF